MLALSRSIETKERNIEEECGMANWMKRRGKRKMELKGEEEPRERGSVFPVEPWEEADWINPVTEEEGAALDKGSALASSVSQPFHSRMFFILMVFWLLFPDGDKGSHSFIQKVTLMQLQGGRTVVLVPIMCLHFYKVGSIFLYSLLSVVTY